MKKQNYKNIKYITLLVIILLIAFFIFFQNDKTYLQKKTIKLIKLATPTSLYKSNTALFRKIHEIAKYIHFSVEYEVEFDGNVYKDRSLAELRSSMLFYFKKSSNWKITKPLKKDLNIKITALEQKKAEVSFPIKITKENKKLFCKALLHWKKNKKWLIHKIKVFSCSPIHN